MMPPIEKRNLQLREEYQIAPSMFAFTEGEVLTERDLIILGIAPNGGKTEISIHVIDRWLRAFPTSRVLVLAHSTNVIKDNFKHRLDGLNITFNYSDEFDVNAAVHIALPSSEIEIYQFQYDLVIVDEAHENYLAERMPRIIKRIRPKKQILLTGTPAKFIKEGYREGEKMFIQAVSDIPEKYFVKLGIELVTSNYKWASNFNNDYELESNTKLNLNDTRATLESVLLRLMERLHKNDLSTEEFIFKKSAVLELWERGVKKFKNWFGIYKELGKTLIICKSIKQSNDTLEILLEHGVNAAVSHSKRDKKSESITKFKDGDYNVLIVVDRTRLGFSDEDLFNIIDMSGSHNPNMIYQMISRVLRGDPEMQKLYLKVTTQEEGMESFTHACVCAALMLTNHKYLASFNGDNFKGLPVPIITRDNVEGNEDLIAKLENENERLKKKLNKLKDKTNEKEPKAKKEKIYFPAFTNDVIYLFREIAKQIGQPASIYKATEISTVRRILFGNGLPEPMSMEEIYATVFRKKAA